MSWSTSKPRRKPRKGAAPGIGEASHETGYECSGVWRGWAARPAAVRLAVALGLYFILLAGLFIRVRSSAGAGAEPARRLEAPAAEWRVVRLHHGLFYLVLLSSLVEYMIAGHPAAMIELSGVVLFAAGLALYRAGGKALGPALSPLLSPVSTSFRRDGIYRFIRHPMYLGQILMAAGAPLVLGSYLSLAAALLFVAVVLVRMWQEEKLLRDLCPGYGAYCKRVSRLIPLLY